MITNKTHKLILSVLILGMLFILSPLTAVKANSETGFDYINEDDKYEFKWSLSEAGTYIDITDDTSSEESIYVETNNEYIVTDVDENDEEITVRTGDSVDDFTKDIPNPSLSTPSDEYDYGHGSFSINGLSASNPFILATWDEYTEKFGDLEDELDNATDDFEHFEGTLNIDDDAQRIHIKMEYLQGAQSWKVNGSDRSASITYDVVKEITIKFDNFVLQESKKTAVSTINEIINETYLEDNEIIYSQEENGEETRRLLGFMDKYGGWIWLGIGIGIPAIAGIIIWIKRSSIKRSICEM